MADEYLKTALYGIKTFNKKVEEKVWMIKLLDLLNEYETPRSWIVFKSYDDYDWTLYWVDCDWETEIAWSDAIVCWKRFWFINRLIENDKIDTEKFYKKSHKIISDYDLRWDYEWLESELIMILSIQEDLIKFLISILK